MLVPPARRSLLALAGATAGIASLAVGSTAAVAQSDPESAAERGSWLPPDTQRPPAPDSHGTCTDFRDFLPDHPINVPVPTTGSGNGHCILVQGNRGAGVKVLQSAIFNCYPQLRGVLGPVDAIYGPNTRDAVIFVQAIEGVGQDGRYGPNTKNAMLWPGYDSRGNVVDCLPLV
ncbi:MAG: peptidoglycan-binding domain-containing protein [Natronosporangium sp.]